MMFKYQTPNIKSQILRRGFTLMELIIAIALLGIIMAATSTLFVIGIRSYQKESRRNVMQKELNFMADDIGTQIKQAAKVPENYNTYIRGPQTLILALPAIDNNEDFIYSGEDLLYDYYIYYLENGSIYKKIFPNPSSTRQERSSRVLDKVTGFNCLYAPASETEIVECTIETGDTVSGTALNFSAQKTARLRNHR